jgi:DNA polymerase III delta prime subunit
MSYPYLEDVPAATPKFNYHLVANALKPLLTRKSDGAIVVGIHGPWGSGKTTLMQTLQRELFKQYGKERAVFINFNAWKFQDKHALWRALILHVLGELKSFGGLSESKVKELEDALYRSFAVEEKGPWKLNWRALIVELLGILLSVIKLDFVARALKESTGWFGRLFSWGDATGESKDEAVVNKERVEKLASVLERTTVERQVQQIKSIEQFLTKFRELIEELTKAQKRVFVFIDDLDRCLPESALEIFEAIKLFLDAPGCGYALALDRDVIRKGLSIKYSQQSSAGRLFIDPDEYIEKTISLSYDLPRLSDTDVLEIIGGFELPIKLDERHKEIIVAGLGANPRRIKRFMNTLSVQLHLAALAKESDFQVQECLVSNNKPRQFDVFLKLLIIAYRYSGIFTLAVEDKELLRRLQEVSNKYGAAIKAKGLTAARTERNGALAEEPPLVLTLRDTEEFWRLLGPEVPPSLLENYQFVTGLLTWFRQSTGLAQGGQPETPQSPPG